MDNWLPVLLSAIGTGLVTWGAIRVELRWLRRDVDDNSRRINRIENALMGRRPGRFSDFSEQPPSVPDQ